MGTAIAALTPCWALAGGSFVDSPTAIQGTDGIYWATLGATGTAVFNPTLSRTAGGLRYRVAKPNDGAMSISSVNPAGFAELCLDARNSRTITLEFERPVTGVGATVHVSSPYYSILKVRAFDAAGNVIVDNTLRHVQGFLEPGRFLGAIGGHLGVKAIEYSTDYGVLLLGQIQIRREHGLEMPDGAGMANAMPSAADDRFFATRNSDAISPEPNVIFNDVATASVELVDPPKNAAQFNLNADGSFYYRPLAGFKGSDFFTYRAIGNDGRSVSKPAKAIIEVAAINRAPKFRGGPDQAVKPDGRRHVVPGWASEMSAGAPDEADQSLTWVLANDNPGLFAEAPALDREGTLTFALVKGIEGSARISVRLRDDGGTAIGGIDSSAAYRFTITSVMSNHAPVLDTVSEHEAGEGERVVIRVGASDPDYGQSIVYELVSGPEGASIHPINGTITWDAKEGSGAYDLVVRASDTGYPVLSDTRTIRVQVAPRAPLAPTVKLTSQFTAEAGREFTATFGAAFGPGEASFMLGTSVRGASLDVETGEFRWTPADGQAGLTFNFLVTALDRRTGRPSDIQSFSVKVTGSSRPVDPYTLTGLALAHRSLPKPVQHAVITSSSSRTERLLPASSLSPLRPRRRGYTVE